MIREQIVEGVAYACLHGSVIDRNKARRFCVTAVPAGGPYVEGYFTDNVGQVEGGTVAVDVRLLRAEWADWRAGRVPQRTEYVHKDVAGWLRRIARHPDASDELRAAAERQLSAL